MILDNVNNYDLSNFMGLDLSSFKTDTLYFVSLLFVFSILTIIFVVKNENNKVNVKNAQKEKLSLIEKEKYKTESKVKFENLNKKDPEVSVIYKNIDDNVILIEEFIKQNNAVPIYSTLISELSKDISEYRKDKGDLLNSLIQGVPVNSQNDEFIKYKNSLLKINDGYKNILKYSINEKNNNDKIDITDI